MFQKNIFKICIFYLMVYIYNNDNRKRGVYMYYNNFNKVIKAISENFSDIVKQCTNNTYEYKGTFFVVGFIDCGNFIQVKIIDIHEAVILNFNIRKCNIQPTDNYFYDIVMKQIKMKISHYYDMQLALEK